MTLRDAVLKEGNWLITSKEIREDLLLCKINIVCLPNVISEALMEVLNKKDVIWWTNQIMYIDSVMENYKIV